MIQGLFRYKNDLEGIFQFTLQVFLRMIMRQDSMLSIPFRVKENFSSNFFFYWGPEESDLGTAWGEEGMYSFNADR